jgi:ribosomal protein S14
MKNKKKIDKKRRYFFKKYEFNKNILKFLAYNTNLKFKQRWNFLLQLQNLPQFSSKSKIHNFCVITGRSKSIFKQFKISRIMFKHYSDKNKLPGLYKKSW